MSSAHLAAPFRPEARLPGRSERLELTAGRRDVRRDRWRTHRRRPAGTGRRPPSSRASRRRTGPDSPPHPDDARVVGRRGSRRSTVVTRCPAPWSDRAIRNGSRRPRSQDLVGQPQASRAAIQGSASTPLADAPATGGPPRTGTGRRSAGPVSAAVSRDDPARLVVVGVARRVERDGDDPRRRDEARRPARASVDEPGQRRDREGRLGQVVEVVARRDPACGP